MVLYLSRTCPCVLHAVLWSHIGTPMRLLTVEPRSTSGLLFTCQYLCGTIMMTPYSIMWDWRVSRAGPKPFYWPSCSLPLCLLLFSLYLLSFYGLVLWGWGLRTDRVLIAVSQPCTANIFKIIIIMIIIIIKSCVRQPGRKNQTKCPADNAWMLHTWGYYLSAVLWIRHTFSRVTYV